MRVLIRVFVIVAVLSSSLPSIVFSLEDRIHRDIGDDVPLFVGEEKKRGTGRFEIGPAEVWLAKNDAQGDESNRSRSIMSPWMPSIPRGAIVVCYVEITAQDVKSDRFKYAQVKTVDDDSLRVPGGVQIITSLPAPRGNEVRSLGRGKAPALKFSLYVSVKATLGPRTLSIIGTKGPPLLLKNTLRVSNPLVVIVDIDGMRREEFYSAIVDPSYGCPNLRSLLGIPIEEGTYLNSKGLSWREYQSGIAVNEAVTVFPTVTFAGHAAIVSGADLGQLNMAGNEWFDRDEVYKFAFTGDNIGLGAGDAIRSFNFGFANERLLKSKIKTVFQEAHDKFGVISYAGHIMYFGDSTKKAAYWDPMTAIDQVHYRPVDETPLTDRSMVGKARGLMDIRERPPKKLILPKDWKPIRGLNIRGDPIIMEEPPIRYHFSKGDLDHLGIVTLYYAGLDHLSHEGDNPPYVEGREGKQAIYLRNHVDPSLGEFLSALSDVTYKNATFLFTADHGQTTMTTKKGDPGDTHASFSKVSTVPGQKILRTHKFQDLLWELGYYPNGVYKVIGEDGKESSFYAGDSSINPIVLGTSATPTADVRGSYMSAVVGLNGGMAHIYLRRTKNGKSPSPRPRENTDLFWDLHGFETPYHFESWHSPPTSEQIYDAAAWFHDQLQHQKENPDVYNESIDLILVRYANDEDEDLWNADWDANYFEFPGLIPSPLGHYFRSGKGKQFLEKNGWHGGERDALLVINRIRRLQGKMSGDLILIPNYPKFYAEYKPLYGDHGSLFRSDFEIPFVLARPGADEHDMAFLRQVLEEGIELDTEVDWEKGAKNRPSNTDVKKVVLNLLQPREREIVEANVTKGRISKGKMIINNSYK